MRFEIFRAMKIYILVPANRSSTVLQNVGNHLEDYITSQPRKP
jgi:hypothetical protein